MQLSHITCLILDRVSRADSAAFALVNPECRPGGLLGAVSGSGTKRLSGQLACRLAVAEFIDHGLTYYGKSAARGRVISAPGSSSTDRGRNLLAAAFRAANHRVVEFAERMTASGRAVTSLQGFVLAEGIFSVARVGGGACYLLRGDEIFPFFETEQGPSRALEESRVGDGRDVDVQLAGVQVEPYDLLCISSDEITSVLARATAQSGVLRVSEWSQYAKAERDLMQLLKEQAREVPFIALVRIGPSTVYLPSYARLPSW